MSNPTVKVTVDFESIFSAISDGVVFCSNYNAYVGDSFFTYEAAAGSDPQAATITISNDTTPPTITLTGKSQDFDFEVYDKSTNQPASGVYLNWFKDAALKKLKTNVPSNAIRYQTQASNTLDITMSLVTKNTNNPSDPEEYTIRWDPIIVVKDVDPQ